MLKIHAAAFFALARFSDGAFAFLSRLCPWAFYFDHLGREIAHLLEAADGLVLVGDFESSLVSFPRESIAT